jgi:hypothetical protein
MELCPVPYECQGPGFKAASKDGPVDGDGRPSSGVVSVEVGDWVIALVPIHVVHHTLERAYPGHGMTVAFVSDDREQLSA